MYSGKLLFPPDPFIGRGAVITLFFIPPKALSVFELGDLNFFPSDEIENLYELLYKEYSPAGVRGSGIRYDDGTLQKIISHVCAVYKNFPERNHQPKNSKKGTFD